MTWRARRGSRDETAVSEPDGKDNDPVIFPGDHGKTRVAAGRVHALTHLAVADDHRVMRRLLGYPIMPDLRRLRGLRRHRWSHAERRVGARESEAGLVTESDVEPARPGGRIADDALRVDAEFVAAGQRGTGGSVPLLRWSSPAQVALPPVLRAARRFVPSAGRRDKERARSAGQEVIVAASPVVQPNGMGHMRR